MAKKNKNTIVKEDIVAETVTKKDKIMITFKDEEWAGNVEPVVKVSLGKKEIVKFTLSSFKSAYGDFMLENKE